jgi:YesN/AraC family two-component response regulator
MPPPKVLIVDDEPIMRNLVRSVNDSLGFETIEATNGLDGLHAFQNGQPDLVISDVYMPKSDGVELLCNIRTVNPGAKVILMTGHPHFKLSVIEPSQRPDGFLVKPFSVSTLVDMMHEILANIKPEKNPEKV